MERFKSLQAFSILILLALTLVDAMQVLLILFLITILVVRYTVPVELAKESKYMLLAKPEANNISIARNGNVTGMTM